MDFHLDQIKLIVGLGNVGDKYERTRHNTGFMFVDLLSSHLDSGVNWQSQPKMYTSIAKHGSLRLSKPTTMMNLSGNAVAAIINYFDISTDEILIVHDDLDIPLGKTKLQFSKGPVKHNGVDSVEKSLSTDKFWRLRLGIENRIVKGNKGTPGMKYSLANFSPEERNLLNQAMEQVINLYF